MDAKIAAEKIKSGLDNISVSDMLVLYKSLKGNSEFSAELSTLNHYAKNHISAFGNAKFAISLDDAIAYQKLVDTFGRDEKGQPLPETAKAQHKINELDENFAILAANGVHIDNYLTPAQRAVLDEHGYMYDGFDARSVADYQNIKIVEKVLKDEKMPLRIATGTTSSPILVDAAERDDAEILKDKEIEHNLSGADEDVIKKNEELLNKKTPKEGKQDELLGEFHQIVARVNITGEKYGVSDHVYVNKILEASMIEAEAYNLGDPETAKLKPDDKQRKLMDDYASIALTKIASLSAMEGIRPAQGKECDPQAPEYKTYLQEYSVKVKDAVRRILSDKNEKINISADSVITACADTTVRMNEYAEVLEKKTGKSSILDKLKTKIEKFDKSCKALWKNRHEIAKNVVESVRNNKWQVGLGLGGSLAVTGATLAAGAASASVTAPIVLGYMAYTSASAWAGPILDEASALRKDAREGGKKLGLFESLKQARKNKAADPKYTRKAVINTGFAVVGAGLIGAGHLSGLFGTASEKAAPLFSAATERLISSVSRIAGSNTALAVECRMSKTDYENAPAEQKEALRRNYIQAKNALAIGVIVGGLAAYAGIHSANAHDAAEQATVSATAGHDNNGVVSTGAVAAAATAAHDSLIGELPAYNQEMGITSAQYNVLLSTRSHDDLLKMYNNLNDGVMKNFEGMTKEQLLFKYNRLDAVTKIVNPNTGISIENATRYHWDSELKDLKAMLECGDEMTVARMSAAKAALMHIQPNGQYVGPGDNLGVSDFYLINIKGNPCPEDNINYYAHGGKVVVNQPQIDSGTPAPVKIPEQAPLLEIDDEPVTMPQEVVPIDNTVPVQTPEPQVTPPSAEPQPTRYVPLTHEDKFKDAAERMAYLKKVGAVYSPDDDAWYVPSKDGTGVEFDLYSKDELKELGQRPENVSVKSDKASKVMDAINKARSGGMRH